MASFKELEVFQLSVQFVKSFYHLVEQLPDNEKFGLSS